MLAEALHRRKDAAAIAATRATLSHDAREARSYSVRQAWILVPGAVVFFALKGQRGRSETSST